MCNEQFLGIVSLAVGSCGLKKFCAKAKATPILNQQATAVSCHSHRGPMQAHCSVCTEPDKSVAVRDRKLPVPQQHMLLRHIAAEVEWDKQVHARAFSQLLPLVPQPTVSIPLPYIDSPPGT